MMSIPYGRQNILQEDIDAVVQVLTSDFMTQGPMVDEFEKHIGQYVGNENVVAVTNGTAGLHLAAMAMGVKPGDNVLVAAISFVASANAIRYCGGHVDFVDIDIETFSLDILSLQQKLQSKPKGFYSGIVVVDFAGYPVKMQELRQIADLYDLWIIEDACHAIGGEFLNTNGQVHQVGGAIYSDVAVLSFHPVKHIATGEGGAIVCRTKEICQHIKKLRTHGITKNPTEMTQKIDGGWYYEMQELGYNYRIPDVLCALGVSQMKRLKSNIASRNRIANIYRQELANTPLQLKQTVSDKETHAYHLFIVLTDQRLKLYEFLKENKIFTQVHYMPIYKHPYYVNLYGQMSLKTADDYYSKTLSLPMYHALKDSDLQFVIDRVKQFFK